MAKEKTAIKGLVLGIAAFFLVSALAGGGLYFWKKSMRAASTPPKDYNPEIVVNEDAARKLEQKVTTELKKLSAGEDKTFRFNLTEEEVSAQLFQMLSSGLSQQGQDEQARTSLRVKNVQSHLADGKATVVVVVDAEIPGVPRELYLQVAAEAWLEDGQLAFDASNISVGQTSLPEVVLNQIRGQLEARVSQPGRQPQKGRGYFFPLDPTWHVDKLEIGNGSIVLEGHKS
ncbi:MAG: hypothetical protein HYV63_10420 [Candidatus Schekmanbacteria bacterium]|nr:hypothetical protein [Candidatus Schekmanbacteria bacterium]